MGGPLNLPEMLKTGYKRHIRLFALETKNPPAGRHWLIIGGCIGHITLTDSILYAGDENQMFGSGGWIIFRTVIPSASATGAYSIFNTAGAVTQAQICPLYVLEDNEILYFNGGAGSEAAVEVIEW